MTAKKNPLEAQQAAQWRAIEPLLPEIIKRGVACLLAAKEPTSEMGLSGKAPKPKRKDADPIDEIIDWENLPNAELLEHSSDPALAERLRRSMEAFEIFNQSSSFKLAPTPSALASHADAGTDYAKMWLAKNGHHDRLKAYLDELGFSDFGAASQGNRVALAKAGVKSARQLFKWSEAAYGEYQW